MPEKTGRIENGWLICLLYFVPPRLLAIYFREFKPAYWVSGHTMDTITQVPGGTRSLRVMAEVYLKEGA